MTTGTITYGSFTATTDSTVGPKLIDVRGLDGWDGEAEVYRLISNHGGIPGAGFTRPRTFQLTFALLGSDPVSLQTQRAALRAAFNPREGDEQDLVLSWPSAPVVQIACRPVSRVGSLGVHTPTMSIQLVASDPALYSSSLAQTVIPVFVGTGGLSYDVTYDKDYGAAGAGEGTDIANAGDWETWARFEITGPSSGTLQPLSIENVTTGDSITFTGLQVPTGSTLIVETHPARRTVMFSDGVSRWNTVTAVQWWPIDAGGASLRFRATGDTTGVVCTCITRAAYL